MAKESKGAGLVSSVLFFALSGWVSSFHTCSGLAVSLIVFSRCAVKLRATSLCSLEPGCSMFAHIRLATAYFDASSTTLLNLSLPARGVVVSRLIIEGGRLQ